MGQDEFLKQTGLFAMMLNAWMNITRAMLAKEADLLIGTPALFTRIGDQRRLDKFRFGQWTIF